jgi:hypothetical protein
VDPLVDVGFFRLEQFTEIFNGIVSCFMGFCSLKVVDAEEGELEGQFGVGIRIGRRR